MSPSNEFQRGCSRPCLSLSFRSPLSVEAGEEKIKGRSRDAVPDPVARTRESNAGGERATCRSRAPRELIIENASEIIFSTREHPTRCFLFFFSFFYFHRGQMYRVSAFRTIKRASTIVNSLSPPRLSDTRWLRCQLFTPIFFNICLSSHVLQYLECIPYYENFFFYKIRDIMIILKPDNGQLSMTSIKR